MLRLFCFASFSSLCFHRSRGPSFNRSSICRPPDSRTCFFLFSFLIIWRCRFFRVFFVPLPFSLCMESTSHVFPFRIVFFYLVATSWIFDISLCENSINHSINRAIQSSRASESSLPAFAPSNEGLMINVTKFSDEVRHRRYISSTTPL